MTSTTTGGPEAKPDVSTVNPVEINSVPTELRSILVLLYDTSSSIDSIRQELQKVFELNPAYLRDYIVPYSGMYLIFYVAQRLSRQAPSSKSEFVNDCIDLFKMFITDYGADPNCQDGVMKQNIFFYAAKAGSMECCRELNRLGVISNLIDVHNQTSLFYAAREGHTEIVEWLVNEGGCNINHLDRNGQTALFYAAREDRVDCVMKMVTDLGSDPLIRDIYKKRARAYLKTPTQKRTYDFLAEIEKARDPNSHLSQRKLFIVRDEPVGAAAMTLRQHKPYNPYQDDNNLGSPTPSLAPPAQKRQRSSASGTSTPASVQVKAPKLERSQQSTPSQSPPSRPSSKPESVASSPIPVGRSRFRIKAPLGKGGLDSFEKTFPDIALWMNGNQSSSAAPPNNTPPKALTRPPRPPVPGLTPPWVPVVSLLLRGPLWRYGPATIFHKQVLQLPPGLGPKYQQSSEEPEKKLSIDLSVIRKKLEKGKYLRLTEVDKDVRSMFEQAFSLVPRESPLGLLSKATEIYYDQQLAGSGLARVIREEAEEVARNARASILSRGDGQEGDVKIQ